MQLCPPPSKFRPVGELEWAVPCPRPLFIKRPARRTGRRAAGVRYEARAHQHFSELFKWRYFPSPWFKYKTRQGRIGWCQPDALLFDLRIGRIVILEMKFQHTSDAWWQLLELYVPVVQAACGNLWRIAVCEVVSWYDPATAFPTQVTLARCPSIVRPGSFGVHIYRP